MLHLYHYGESYGRAVASDFGVSLDAVQKQLGKFERAGLLVSKRQGRTLVDGWNPKSRGASRLKDLVGIYYESLPEEIHQEKLATRRRPRSKDKPIIYGN
jgi:DNA-binding transcriptional regulator YhcF (GntR family)